MRMYCTRSDPGLAQCQTRIAAVRMPWLIYRLPTLMQLRKQGMLQYLVGEAATAQHHDATVVGPGQLECATGKAIGQREMEHGSTSALCFGLQGRKVKQFT